MIVSAIAAVADSGTIGINGDLPWHLPDDLKYFMHTTRGHHVIAGRKNYEASGEVPPAEGPCEPGGDAQHRLRGTGAVVLGSLEEALEYARNAGETEVFVIGGGQIYKEAFAGNVVQRLYLTLVHADIAGDTHFPLIDPADWREVKREYHAPDERHAHDFSFVVLER